MTTAILIPTFNPPENFPAVVQSAAEHFSQVLIVNDGSAQAYQGLFEEVKHFSGVQLIEHQKNQGQGAAVKTGLAYFKALHPDLKAVITMDADGQHLVSDALKLCKAHKNEPKKLFFGVREFGPKVPFRSRFGNILTKYIFRWLAGIQISDTQTGMRLIPVHYIPDLLAIKANKMDFAVDFLIRCRDAKIPIGECPIETVYLEENQSSHFRPLVDSYKIYALILRSFFKRFC